MLIYANTENENVSVFVIILLCFGVQNVVGVGTDATQVEMSSYKIRKFFSVGLTHLGKVTLESSGLPPSSEPFKKF